MTFNRIWRIIAGLLLLPLYVLEGVIVGVIMGSLVPLEHFREFVETGEFRLFD